MKAKNRQNRTLVTFIIAIVCVGIWWFTRSTSSAPEKNAEAPMPAKTDAPKPVVPPTISPTVAPLIVPSASKPAVALVAATQTIAKLPPDTNATSIAELKAAFADMARLARAGDNAGFYQTYTPPDKFDPVKLQAIQENQEAMQRIPVDQTNPAVLQQMREAGARAIQDLEDQTPTFNAAGDEATYMFRYLGTPDKLTPRVFIKINGQWYEKGVNSGK